MRERDMSSQEDSPPRPKNNFYDVTITRRISAPGPREAAMRGAVALSSILGLQKYKKIRFDVSNVAKGEEVKQTSPVYLKSAEIEEVIKRGVA